MSKAVGAEVGRVVWPGSEGWEGSLI